ncbi:MAG: RNA polymerase sigma factor [Rhodospirillaceae bacterium]|nr:RNA polymerase sigma factor [Rhodospirillaceae bacterium]
MSAADQPDAVLASDAQNGNRRAFDLLVIRHKAQIYRIARHYIGNAADALDIVQDTFVAAWLALGSYDNGRDFGAWLRTIALNKCRDFGRRQAVRRNVTRLFGLLDVRERTEPSADVIAENAQTDNLRLQALDRAVATLPAAQKEVIVLTAFAGLSQQEVAAQLGTSVKSVEMKVRRAKQRLEELLRSDGIQ